MFQRHRRKQHKQTNEFMPYIFLLVDIVNINQSTPNSFYPYNQMALSRTLLWVNVRRNSCIANCVRLVEHQRQYNLRSRFVNSQLVCLLPVFNYVTFICYISFLLFQWHACKLAKLSTCIAQCMTTINKNYIKLTLHLRKL